MKTLAAYLLPTIILLSGCNPGFGGSSNPQTLVVDPLPVAKSLGRDELMQKKLNVQIDQLNSQLNRQTTELSTQLEQEKQKLGAKPSEEATKHYQALVAAATQQAKQYQLQTQQHAAQYRQSLLSDFNKEVRNVAAEIAKKRGATSVLVIGDNVLWFDASADITAEVIEKLRAQSLQVQDVPANTSTEHAKELKNLESVIQSIENDDKSAK